MHSTHRYTGLLLACLWFVSQSVHAQLSADTPWVSVNSSDGSVSTPRHEASAVGVANNFYLMGGRGNRPLEIYNTVTRQWRNLGPAPNDLHHFQPVVVGQKIYILGAFTGSYPNEPSVGDIYVFDTVSEQWATEGEIPEARRRGSAAAVFYNDRIYLVGGNTLGHNGGAVPWLDSYDPQTGQWQILSDAPNARDHFAAAVVDDQLVAAAGRQTEQPNPFVNPVLPTDVYDFASDEWTSGADIPTPRAGTMIATAGSELLVAGGEIASSSDSLDTTEAYDVLADRWRSLRPMIDPRHSGGGAVINNIWHVVGGSLVKGGPLEAEINRHESMDLSFDAPADSDGDGISDEDEINIHGTDPALADTDNDLLTDGQELQLGTNPLNADTDADELPDAQEVGLGTNPLTADTDSDNLSDAQEVALGTDPSSLDSDADGLNDGQEIDLGTNPLSADSDEDGLSDGDEVNLHDTNALAPDTDSDTLPDAQELELGTDPGSVDSDSDGVGDAREVSLGINPLNADSDEDGLNDLEELSLGSDPLNADSDDDGVPDGSDPTPVGDSVPPAKKKSRLGAASWIALLMGLVVAYRRF